MDGVPRPDAPASSTVVTTARQGSPDQEARARCLADELMAPFVPREALGRPLAFASREAAVLVVERERLSLWIRGERLVYHPGMALPRIQRISAGEADPMLDAFALRPGERVIDATLGLASDALVAAWAGGERTSVVGLEKVAVLGALTREGLQAYPWRNPRLAAAARRITVVTADHVEYLGRAPEKSADVVYFDAMFERPLERSTAMMIWRRAASLDALDPAALTQALRVARRRVVVKDRRDSTRLGSLAPPVVTGGRSSPVAYGVWDVTAAS